MYICVWGMLVYDVINVWHHYDAVYRKKSLQEQFISQDTILVYTVYYKMHVNTPTETLCKRKFSNVRIQYQDPVLV